MRLIELLIQVTGLRRDERVSAFRQVAQVVPAVRIGFDCAKDFLIVRVISRTVARESGRPVAAATTRRRTRAVALCPCASVATSDKIASPAVAAAFMSLLRELEFDRCRLPFV